MISTPIKAIAYHGTKDIIQEFEISPNVIGSNTYNNGGCIFFTSEECVATQYSIEAKYRELESKLNTDAPDEIYDKLREEAILQAHCYEVELDIYKPLVLDIANINQDEKSFCTSRGLHNVLDSYILNHLVNLLQDRRYQKYMGVYDEDINYNVIESFSYLFEKYNNELDEYEEVPHDYDCIIIENCIDSINEDSNYMPSTIYAVLDPSIIKIERYIKE